MEILAEDLPSIRLWKHSALAGLHGDPELSLVAPERVRGLNADGASFAVAAAIIPHTATELLRSAHAVAAAGLSSGGWMPAWHCQQGLAISISTIKRSNMNIHRIRVLLLLKSHGRSSHALNLSSEGVGVSGCGRRR